MQHSAKPSSAFANVQNRKREISPILGQGVRLECNRDCAKLYPDEMYKQKLGTHILPSDTVLDFGCGTGIITSQIARNADKVYGVDISEEMLKRARQKAKDQHIDNAAFLKITALGDMFRDDYFQVITVFNVLQYVDNRKELFRQFYKLLKPQGTLVIAAPCLGDMNTFSTAYVKFLRFARIMPETFFFRVDEIEREITGAGLTIVESINLLSLPEKFIVAKKIKQILICVSTS